MRALFGTRAARSWPCPYRRPRGTWRLCRRSSRSGRRSPRRRRTGWTRPRGCTWALIGRSVGWVRTPSSTVGRRCTDGTACTWRETSHTCYYSSRLSPVVDVRIVAVCVALERLFDFFKAELFHNSRRQIVSASFGLNFQIFERQSRATILTLSASARPTRSDSARLFETNGIALNVIVVSRRLLYRQLIDQLARALTHIWINQSIN